MGEGDRPATTGPRRDARRRLVRVLSWQGSGVAWVPWRISRCLAAAGADDIDFVLSGPDARRIEAYDISRLELEANDPISAIAAVVPERGVPDIVHLHHAALADRYVASIRRAWPTSRILVTIHGEPDRRRNRVCANAPDYYHVVEPGLFRLTDRVGTPARFIPNHPGIDLARNGDEQIPARLFVPYSHVGVFKDLVALRAVEEELDESWFVVHQGKRLSNAANLEAIASSEVAWVQLQGYLDLTVFECWALGTFPVVLRPPVDLFDAWATVLGARPELPIDTRDPKAIASFLTSREWQPSIETNRRVMADSWTARRAGDAWAAFYRELVE